ncbi:MAG: ATP-binding cassette domain-containing protein, partial [Clostridia bacterium]|nr:ATP-binding cassette domain-containing protein [Clostridia bacterium]
MAETFIKVEDLSYLYDADDTNVHKALRNVSFEINKGEFVAILGHNGSGKSTLAKLLNIILTPTEGKIFVGGKDVTDQNMSDEDILALRKTVGMVFQNPDNQLVATIVEDDVAFGPENLGVSSPDIRKRVDEVLGYV